MLYKSAPLLLTLLFLVLGTPLSAQSSLDGPESASDDFRPLVRDWSFHTAAGGPLEPEVAFPAPQLDPLRFSDDDSIDWKYYTGVTLLAVGLPVAGGGLLWMAVGEFHPIPTAMGAAAAVTGWVLLRN